MYEHVLFNNLIRITDSYVRIFLNSNFSLFLLIFFFVCTSDLHSLMFSFFLTGLGRTAPDPSAAVTLNGVQVPLGKGAHTNIDDTSLLYNEYPLNLIIWFVILRIFFFTFTFSSWSYNYFFNNHLEKRTTKANIVA